MVANAVAADNDGAAALALAGLVPAVTRFSDPRWPEHSVRVEVGRFLCGLASGPPPLVNLLVACQVHLYPSPLPPPVCNCTSAPLSTYVSAQTRSLLFITCTSSTRLSYLSITCTKACIVVCMHMMAY